MEASKQKPTVVRDSKVTETGPLMIAIATLGKVRAEWAMHICHAVMPVGRIRNMVLIQGMSINDARNYAVEVAKESGASRLMFWDDDILPRSQQALMLMTQAMDRFPEIDILGGVYPGRVRDVNEPIIVKEEGGGTWEGWRDGNIYPCYMTGTGFMVIRTQRLVDVEENIEPYVSDQGYELRKWFTPDNEMEISDDVHFARLAKLNGLSWFVHGAVVCDQADLDGELYRIADPADMPQLVMA